MSELQQNLSFSLIKLSYEESIRATPVIMREARYICMNKNDTTGSFFRIIGQRKFLDCFLDKMSLIDTSSGILSLFRESRKFSCNSIESAIEYFNFLVLVAQIDQYVNITERCSFSSSFGFEFEKIHSQTFMKSCYGDNLIKLKEIWAEIFPEIVKISGRTSEFFIELGLVPETYYDIFQMMFISKEFSLLKLQNIMKATCPKLLPLFLRMQKDEVAETLGNFHDMGDFTLRDLFRDDSIYYLNEYLPKKYRLGNKRTRKQLALLEPTVVLETGETLGLSQYLEDVLLLQYVMQLDTSDKVYFLPDVIIIPAILYGDEENSIMASITAYKFESQVYICERKLQAYVRVERVPFIPLEQHESSLAHPALDVPIGVEIFRFIIRKMSRKK